VQQVTGYPPTDISLGCCDRQGNWTVYLGLSGKLIRDNPPPQGAARLPESALNLYQRFTDAMMEAVERGAAAEDHAKGYALSAYPPLRIAQLNMRTYALRRESLLVNILSTSSDDQHRAAAAHLLGYSRKSKSQLIALARASRDVNSTVRNNATRALFGLAESDPKAAAAIPMEHFVELLSSGIWTDLNKASNLLSSITRSRNEMALARLRSSETLERLIEMARWRTGHAEVSRYILGRLAGIPEDRLAQLVKAGKVEEIIQELQGK
jgi:hypothetical protein